MNYNYKEPQYAVCGIVWKNTNDQEYAKIQLSSDIDPDKEDDIFFYCNSLTGFESLCEFGGEDFIVTEYTASKAIHAKKTEYKMKKISITKVKKGLSSLHVKYSDFSQVYKINDYTAEICIQYASWIKDDILAVINYLKSNYKVEERSNGTIIITPHDENF